MADTTAELGDHEALASPQEIHDKAHLCVAAEEFEQAIDFFSQAVALVSTKASPYAVSLSLLPTEDLRVSPASLIASLLLERADCYVKSLDFERALVDTSKTKELGGDCAKLARVQCEAMLGLKQERHALKVWTAALLKTPLSPELKLLKRKFPIAAVHVLHAVALAKAEAAARQTAIESEDSPIVEGEQPRSEAVVVVPEVQELVDIRDKTSSSDEPGTLTPPPEIQDAAQEDVYQSLPDLDAMDDQQTAWLLGNRSGATLSEPGTPLTASVSGLDASVEATEISPSMMLSSPFVSVNGSDYTTSLSSLSSYLDASFVNMDLVPTRVATIESTSAFVNITDAIRAQPPTPDMMDKLYDHALAVEANSSSTAAQKITAFLQYVSFTPVDDQWMAHALYSVSALYLESRKYSEAAQMRFLAEECEKLQEQLGVYPPVDGIQMFPKKREVENAFTLPWLVLSFDQQRVCVENGSLHCHLCGCETPVPLVQYIEHRTKLCAARKAAI